MLKKYNAFVYFPKMFVKNCGFFSKTVGPTDPTIVF